MKGRDEEWFFFRLEIHETDEEIVEEKSQLLDG